MQKSLLTSSTITYVAKKGLLHSLFWSKFFNVDVRQEKFTTALILVFQNY